MKTKLNIAGNNTDWSVSNFEIKIMNQNTDSTATRSENARFLRAYPQLNVEKRASDRTDTNIEQARMRAAALAWSTDYPFLVLPCLTEELEQEAIAYMEKQRHVYSQTEALFPQAFPIAAEQLAA